MAIEKVETESDSDIFRSAMADEPEAVEQSEPKVDATGRLHGQDGKYVPKANEAEAAPIQQQAETTHEPVQQEAQTKEDAQVPSWRLRELREQREAAEQRAQRFERDLQRERDERQAIERRFQQTQQPQEKVDWFADPEAAHQQRIDPLEQQFKTDVGDLRLDNSKTRAMVRYGVQAYDEMENALQKEISERGVQDPELKALAVRMFQSRDPAEVCMSWYKQNKVHREIGGDLNAYLTKRDENLLKDPAFLAKALDAARAQAGQPGKQSTVQIPPSLNKAAGGSGNEAEKGDMSDASLWAESRPTGRRK